MKRIIIGLTTLLGMLYATSALADMKDITVPVKLVVLEIIDLEVTKPADVIPTAEDYAYLFSSCKNYVTTCSTAPVDEHGFADRHDAISVTTFTNARKGATVHVAGHADPAHNDSLRVGDVYLTVMREKTYVLKNSTAVGTELAVTGGIDGAWAMANTATDVGEKYAKWLQMNTEAKKFFGVTEATEAKRLWVLKLGIGSLAEYTADANGYTMDLTFILIPEVV